MRKVKIYLAFGIIMTLIGITSVSAQLPDFRIASIDSTYYGVKYINKKDPVLFMYFSPSCEECSEMTSAILNKIGDLKNTQIVMITNESLIEVRKFIMHYGINEHKNIIIGTEGHTYRFAKNFQIGKLPFLVFYNNKAKLIMTYNNATPAKDFVSDVLKSSN